jgi:hypothetical protein
MDEFGRVYGKSRLELLAVFLRTRIAACFVYRLSARRDQFPNLTVKKIPLVVLSRIALLDLVPRGQKRLATK